MKRLIVLSVVALVLATGLGAQELSGLGRDFEIVFERVGAAALPAITQSAIWGQYTGVATFAPRAGFFLTLSAGALFTDGLLGFVDEEDTFTVLNVPNLFQAMLDNAPTDRAADAYEWLKTAFPVPVSRIGMGFRLPGDVEAMIAFGGVPGFLVGPVYSRIPALDGFELGMVHVGTKIRRAVLADAGPFPALSLGLGYSYTGLDLGYDLATISPGGGEYGTIEIAVGDLNVKGRMSLRSRVHAFGLDLHASKAIGFFVPYLGLSPYYHLASFGGSVGPGDEFDAYVNNPETDNERDIEYTGAAPESAWVENDLSLVLFGGFDMFFGRFVFQVNGSWGIAKGIPGVALNVRWQ